MTEEQRAFLISIHIDPDKDLSEIEDAVNDYLMLKCFDENYNPNEEGMMCESILDYIGEQ